MIRPLYTSDQIQARVNELAGEIIRDYGRAEFLAVSIMKGSFVFTADLIRTLADRQGQPVLDFITLSSYGGGTSSQGRISLVNGLTLPVAGNRVLIIDDILDTGLTLQTAVSLLNEQGAKEVRTCVLLNKPARRTVPIHPDYCGFIIENLFVVGYGLDFNNRYRQLPHLAVLTPAPSP